MFTVGFDNYLSNRVLAESLPLDWIFDAVVDFDAVLRDPARPRRMRAEFDSGDHLHPGDAGYRKMADAVDIDAIVARDLKARRDAAPASSQ